MPGPITEMATADLNAEPSVPQERKDHHLPPKSYVDAVEQNLDISSIKNTDILVGDGIDNAPRSSSKKTMIKNGGHLRSKGLKNNDNETDMMEASEDKDGETKPTRLSPVKATSKNSVKKSSNKKQDEDLLENFQHENGHKLTSIKQSDSDAGLQLSRKESNHSQNDGHELVSGRKAGTGWEQSKIRFAPLNIPLKRRLQTLVVLWHTLCIALFVTTFFFLCAVPILWPILLPYVLYLLFSTAPTSGTLSRRSQRLRSLPIWSLFASYFPARLHRSQILPPTRKYVLGYHPHGIISHGAFAAFATEALGFAQLFPGITNTLLTLDTNFRIPLYRDYALAMGLGSVSRESCENILSHGGPNGEGMGRAITIVVGGARESLDAQPHTLRLVLKRRKGFVKLAIRAGADLVPVLAFGENDLYDQVQPDTHPMIHKIQLVVKKAMGFTIPLFHARGVFNYDVGLMPYRRPLNIVVGKPIMITQSKAPDETYVDEIHGLYVEELERIWTEWSGEFANGMQGRIEIVE